MHKPAAIYTRVSSDRQKEDHTIASQTAALIEYAQTQGYTVPPEWIFQDEGYSGATLVRPGMERCGTCRKVDCRGLGVLPRPAEPEVRLSSFADGRVIALRCRSDLSEGTGRSHPRRPTGGAVSGNDCRV